VAGELKNKPEQPMTHKPLLDDWLGALFGMIVVLPCFGFVIIGAFVVLQECITWLKTAIWVTPTLYEGLVSFFGPVESLTPSHLETGYLGLDKLVAWALLSPLALWLIVLGPMIWFICWTFVLNALFKMVEPAGRSGRF
jgi:hypothetical protein